MAPKPQDRSAPADRVQQARAHGLRECVDGRAVDHDQRDIASPGRLDTKQLDRVLVAHALTTLCTPDIKGMGSAAASGGGQAAGHAGRGARRLGPRVPARSWPARQLRLAARAAPSPPAASRRAARTSPACPAPVTFARASGLSLFARAGADLASNQRSYLRPGRRQVQLVSRRSRTQGRDRSRTGSQKARTGGPGAGFCRSASC